MDHIKANNYAGPALLLTGVLEDVIGKTVFKRAPTLRKDDGSMLPKTLGTVGCCKDFGGANWPILHAAIMGKGYWKEDVWPGVTYTFERWVDTIALIRPIRNDAAHKARVDRAQFQTLTVAFFGSSMTGLGAFSGLIRAWRATPVPPVQQER